MLFHIPPLIHRMNNILKAFQLNPFGRCTCPSAERMAIPAARFKAITRSLGRRSSSGNSVSSMVLA